MPAMLTEAEEIRRHLDRLDRLSTRPLRALLAAQAAGAADPADLSARPTGTTLAIRLKALNSKSQKVRGFALAYR